MKTASGHRHQGSRHPRHEPLKAEQEGRVRSIHVESGQPVEFGQLLFELDPVDGQPIV